MLCIPQRDRGQIYSFNEGTVARIGANSVFRFRSGDERALNSEMAAFSLRSKPRLGVSTIITPEAIAVAQETVLWGQHNRNTKTTLFGSLTNNSTRPILIFNRKGESFWQSRQNYKNLDLRK